MRLDPTQAKWATDESKALRRIIEAKPEIGMLAYRMRYEILQMIIQLHNMAEPVKC